MTEHLEGPAGTADRIDLSGIDNARAQLTTAWWLFTCPGQSPAWSQYSLWVLNLADTPGLPAGVRDFPGATHEFLLIALDPKHHQTPDKLAKAARKGRSVPRLHPGNVRLQFEGTDPEMTELAARAAWGVANGHLPAEPPLSGGGNRAWLEPLVKTLAHIRGEQHAP